MEKKKYKKGTDGGSPSSLFQFVPGGGDDETESESSHPPEGRKPEKQETGNRHAVSPEDAKTIESHALAIETRCTEMRGGVRSQISLRQSRNHIRSLLSRCESIATLNAIVQIWLEHGHEKYCPAVSSCKSFATKFANLAEWCLRSHTSAYNALLDSSCAPEPSDEPTEALTCPDRLMYIFENPEHVAYSKLIEMLEDGRVDEHTGFYYHLKGESRQDCDERVLAEMKESELMMARRRESQN